VDLPAVPDYFGQFMAPIQRQQALGIEQQNADLAQQQQRLAQAQAVQKLIQAAQYQNDAAQVIANPSADGYRSLLLKYPEMHDSLKTAWDQYGETEKQRDVSAASQVYAALDNGRPELALSLLKDRQTAMLNAGSDDKVTDNLIGMIQSGDPTKIKQAQGIAGMVLATSAGPDKIDSMLNSLSSGQYTLGPGEARLDRQGNVVATSPFLKGENGAIYEKDSPGAATPSAAAATGGMQASISHVLGNEGGYNPKDANGSPTNFGINYKANAAVLKQMGITPANFKNMTQQQAEQIYATKYWPQSGADQLPANLQAPYFDAYIRSPALAKRVLAQSGGDPQKFVELASAKFQAMASNPASGTHPYAAAWAHRDAGNLAIASGAVPAPPGTPAASGAPPGYHVLLPPGSEKPPTGFEPDPNKPGALRPIAGGPADTTSDQMDPETVNFYAQEILTGTPMSQLSFGMGKAAALNRRQVMTQVAKLAGAEGLTGKDLAIQLVHYRAGQKNISNLETQLGTVQGNELTFAQNAQQVAQIASQMPSTSSRLLNIPVNTFLRQTNDPNIAKLDVAIKTAANEYARLVTASPSGAGTLSDSARSEYQNVIDGNFPLAQKLAALHQMAVDGQNRVNSLKSNLQSAYSHLTDRAPELTGRTSKTVPTVEKGWVTLPSGLKVRRVQ
jgi:hypothetical protein